MSLESISKLSSLTGLARETVAKRLADLVPTLRRNSKLYESREALPILFGGENGEYDLTAERARLSHHQANIAALDEKIKQKALIPYDVVVESWQIVLSNFRAKALAVPVSLASVCADSSREEVQQQAEQLVKQMLEELATDVDY